MKKEIQRIFNRIKTLYWFWKLTKDVSDNHWIVETGINPFGDKWFEMWNANEYLSINKSKK